MIVKVYLNWTIEYKYRYFNLNKLTIKLIGKLIEVYRSLIIIPEVKVGVRILIKAFRRNWIKRKIKIRVEFLDWVIKKIIRNKRKEPTIMLGRMGVKTKIKRIGVRRILINELRKLKITERLIRIIRSYLKF